MKDLDRLNYYRTNITKLNLLLAKLEFLKILDKLQINLNI